MEKKISYVIEDYFICKICGDFIGEKITFYEDESFEDQLEEIHGVIEDYDYAICGKCGQRYKYIEGYSIELSETQLNKLR